MATVKVSGKSYLKFSELLESSGVVFWDLPDFPEIPVSMNDTKFDVDERTELRLDNIAMQVYGNPELWWVIALANNLTLIPTELKRGMTLRIPSSDYVFKELLR